MNFEYNSGLYSYKNGIAFDGFEKCLMFDLNDCFIDNMKKIIESNKNILLVCYTNFLTDNVGFIWNEINNIQKELNVNTIFYFTTEFNKYTKPFATILNHINNISFFCGASETNLKFALNCEIPFINLKTLQINDLTNTKINYPAIPKNNQEFFFEMNDNQKKTLILLVGYPASGKSFLAKYIADKYNYFILSLDDYILSKKRSSVDDFENIVIKHNKVIIDYCCLKQIRKKFIVIGKKYDYHIKAIHIDCDIELLKHNSYYRYLKYNREIAKGIYEMNLNLECEIGEGINEIIKLDNIIVKNNDYYKYMF